MNMNVGVITNPTRCVESIEGVPQIRHVLALLYPIDKWLFVLNPNCQRYSYSEKVHFASRGPPRMTLSDQI